MSNFFKGSHPERHSRDGKTYIEYNQTTSNWDIFMKSKKVEVECRTREKARILMRMFKRTASPS